MTHPAFGLKKNYKPQYIKTPEGFIQFNWKEDLLLEEYDEYLPSGYDPVVLELSYIESNIRGGGHKLMEAFLAHPVVKSSELIFLDPNPAFHEQLGISEHAMFKKLHRFYSKHGFVSNNNNPINCRMWRVQKGLISIDKLPL